MVSATSPDQRPFRERRDLVERQALAMYGATEKHVAPIQDLIVVAGACELEPGWLGLGLPQCYQRHGGPLVFQARIG